MCIRDSVSRVEGKVSIEGKNIYGTGVDVVDHRKHVGMFFQKPNPFPMSIYDNIAYGPRIHGVSKKDIDGIVAVSYTHLRAHETDSYLVCRLLLEKKKNTTT